MLPGRLPAVAWSNWLRADGHVTPPGYVTVTGSRHSPSAGRPR